MTSEKAIKLLHRLQDEQFDGIHGDERREALEMAVRALEGDGDTISRQTAIDAVVSAMIDGADAELVEGIKELLPSAQPQRKKGKWVSNGVEAFGVVEYWVCDQCYDQSKYRSNFCPSCGADMRGENE